MNTEALFCDGTKDYVSPDEPKPGELCTLRFRTAHNDVEEVVIHFDDTEQQMWKTSPKGEFDFYEITLRMGTEAFRYYFEIKKGNSTCYYDKFGVTDHIEPFYEFVIMPGFSVPGWVKGAVMYQIFVDRFCNGDPSNDVEDAEYIYIGSPVGRAKSWDAPPEGTDYRHFYGGDLQGVLDKLDYLQDLGVEVVYFNPLFVSPSSHKYDIQDYDHIDPHFGCIVHDGGEVLADGETDNSCATKYQIRTGDPENLKASNKLFMHLVQEMHRRGMRVILDGVFNHCGSFNKWMDRERIYEDLPDYPKGAYVSADSPYRNFFLFHDNRDEAWPYNTSYDGWWSHDTLPKLAYEDSQELEDYIIGVAKKWVSPPYNVDGWRLDVAADLGRSNEYNHEFWKRFRREVKKANPDAVIFAEHYGDPQEWLQGDEWDSVMNYDAFMEPITWFLTGMEKHSDDRREDLQGNADFLHDSVCHYMSCMLMPSLQAAMNQLSNHDHSRFLTRTNHKVGRVYELGSDAALSDVDPAVMREAVVFQMTWTGSPTIYYGDEAGVGGFTDPDCRRTYPWGHEDKQMLAFHKDIIRIHKTEKPLRKGSVKPLYREKNILAYARFEGDEQIVVVLNNNDELREVTIPVWLSGVPMEGKMKRLLYTYADGYTTEFDLYLVQNGEVVLNMGARSAIVLKPIRGEWSAFSTFVSTGSASRLKKQEERKQQRNDR